MAGVVTKRKGFSSLLTFSKKTKSTTDPLSGPSASRFIANPNRFFVKYTLSLSIRGWRKIIYTYDDLSLNNTNFNFVTFKI